MAIRVYLDTQDYVRLYQNRDYEVQRVYDYLCKKVDEGKIEICYSYIIIGEFITSYDQAYKNDRLERINLIKRLCGQNTFLFINRLVGTDEVVSYNGDWLPKFPLLGVLSKPLSQEMGKLLTSLNLNSGNEEDIKNTLRVVLYANPDLYNSRLNQSDFEFPLPDSFTNSNIFMRYLCGEVPEDEIEKVLLETVFDLNKFIDTWFEYASKKNSLYEFIQDSGIGIFNMVDKFVTILETTHSNNTSQLRVIEEAIKSAGLISTFKTEIENTKKELKLYGDLDVDIILQRLDPKLLEIYPKSFFELIIIYARACIKTGRSIKKSDIGDILHAAYLPYSDIWRGDISFCTILKQQKINYHENVVDKFLDLPKRIEAKLNLL